MKKTFLTIALAAVAVVALTSCKEEPKEPTYSPRIATYSEQWEENPNL